MKTLKKNKLLTLLAALALFVLTACGATIDTSMTLEEGASKGSRTMTLRIDDTSDSSEYIKGGMPAVDASIRKHLPEGIEYSGLTEEGNSARATLTISFSSIDDYRTKVKKLLTASGDETEPRITISKSDTGLVTGTIVDENFSSTNLLGWLADGLVADGVVEGSNRGSIFASDGKYFISVDGQEVAKDKSGGTLRFEEVVDNGVGNVLATAEIGEDGNLTGTVILGDSSPLGSVKETKIDEYLTAAQLGDSVTTESQNGDTADGYTALYGKKLTFTAANFDEYTATLNKILGTSGNSIKSTQETSSSDHTRIVTKVSGILDCAAVCSSDGGSARFALVAPQGWEWSNGTGATKSYSSSDEKPRAVSSSSVGEEFTMLFEYAVPLQSLDVNTSIGLGGSVEQTWVYTVKTEDAQATNGGFEKHLAPADGVGEMKIDEKDGLTVYTVTIKGKDSTEFADRLGQYMPGAAFAVRKAQGFSFWPEYTVDTYLPMEDGKLAGGVREGFTYTLDLPALHSYNSDYLPEYVEAKGGRLTAQHQGVSEYFTLAATAKGPGVGGLILLGVLLLLVLAAAVFAYIFRSRLAEGGKKAWAQRGKVVAATSAGLGAATVAARTAGATVKSAAQDAQARLDETGGAMGDSGAPGDLPNPAQATPQQWRDGFSENNMS